MTLVLPVLMLRRTGVMSSLNATTHAPLISFS